MAYSEMAVSHPPDEVIKEASFAAKTLMEVVGKTRKLVLNNKQYLFVEHWQTVGKFYGLTARVKEESVKPIQVGDARGWEAYAEIVHVPTGRVVSGASAMCLDDERNWKEKSSNALRSMAQTRACGKGYRTVLGWVVILAGFSATPAEEMDDVDDAEKPAPSRANGNTITEQQQKILQARMKENGWFLDEATVAPEAIEHLGKLGYEQASQISQKDFTGVMVFFSKKRQAPK